MAKNLFIKIFLVTSIPFGLFMGIFLGVITKNPIIGLVIGTIGGLLFGGGMAAVLGLMQKFAEQNVPATGKASGVHHVREMELKRSYDQAFALCLKAVGCIDNCKVREQKPAEGEIEARTGMNWKTFGDIITFSIRKIADDRTAVRISSRPLMPTTLVDYGKNLENVEKIVFFFEDSEEEEV